MAVSAAQSAPAVGGNHPPGVERKKLLAGCLALVLLTAGVYGQTVGFEFINFDDNALIYENPEVVAGLSVDNLIWAFTSMPIGTWQPLTWLSHMLDCQLFGLNAGYHHLVSVLFHVANTVLLFLLLARWTGALWLSALVAALFGVHPMHVESVAWVAERKDVLSTMGWLLTMWTYSAWVAAPSPRRYLTTLLCFALGLMAKPMLVTLPLILLLWDIWPLQRLPLAGLGEWGQHRRALLSLVVDKLPLLALALASSLVTVLAEMRIDTLGSMGKYPLLFRLANAIIAYGKYLLHAVWPLRLLVFYLYPAHIPAWQTLLALLFLLAVSGLCLSRLKQQPYLAVGWGWYLISLLPVIGLVQQGGVAMANRYSYVPLIGVFIMVVWWVGDLAARWRWRPIGSGLVAGVVLVPLAVLCFREVGYWRDSPTLFGRTLELDPRNYMAAMTLGDDYRDKGQFEQALRYLHEAVRLDPGNHEAFGDLGNAYDKMGRLDEARRYYEEAIRLDPTFVTVYDYLGVIGIKQGRMDMARHYFGKAMEFNPDDPKVWMNYGLALYVDNQLDEAADYFGRVIGKEPRSADAYNALGLVRMKQGRLDEAIASFQSALRIVPDFQHAQENLRQAQAARAGTR